MFYNASEPTYVNESQLLFFNNKTNNISHHPEYSHKKDNSNHNMKNLILPSDDQCHLLRNKRENEAAMVIQKAYRFSLLRRQEKQLRNELEEIRNYIDFCHECDTDKRSGLSNTTTSPSGSKNSSFDYDETYYDGIQYKNNYIYDFIPMDSLSKRPLNRECNRHHSKCPLSKQRNHSVDISRQGHSNTLVHRSSDSQSSPHSVVLYKEDLPQISPYMYIVHSCNHQSMVMGVNSNCPTHKVYHNARTMSDHVNCPRIVNVNGHIQTNIDHNHSTSSDDRQQLSLLRKQSKIIQDNEMLEKKRMYRIGLNIFNKNPVAGINYLIQYQYIKDHPANVANFLLTKSGVCRSSVGDYLGSIGDPLAVQVTKYFLREINMKNKEVDEALRSFIYYVHLPGESQKICHLMEQFKEEYMLQNDRRHQFKSDDTIMVLAYAIIMLQTDAHNPSIRKNDKMTLDQFVINLRGVDDHCDIDRCRLAQIYARIISKEIKTQSDHTDQVRRLNEVIGGPSKPPDLLNRTRRFICYCRMSEITDDGKKNKSDAHRREVFLFNDLLLVCKGCSKSRKDDIQYQCKYLILLVDLRVKLFSTVNHLFGIHFFDRKTDNNLLKLNAQCEQDQKRFMFDVSDYIFESLEMITVNYSDYLPRTSSSANNTPSNRVKAFQSKTVKSPLNIDTHTLPNPSPRRHESLAKIERPDLVQCLYKVRQPSYKGSDISCLRNYIEKAL